MLIRLFVVFDILAQRARVIGQIISSAEDSRIIRNDYPKRVKDSYAKSNARIVCT